MVIVIRIILTWNNYSSKFDFNTLTLRIGVHTHTHIYIFYFILLLLGHEGLSEFDILEMSIQRLPI